MADLVTEVERMRNALRRSIDDLLKHGTDLAQKEHAYQVAKAQTVLQMKDEGRPVTEINLTIKGQDAVAEAMLQRDIAQVLYQTNIEHINATKLELRVLENQISREWGNSIG